MDLRSLYKALQPELHPGPEGMAALPHWPKKDDDFDREDNGDPTLVAEIKSRTPIQIMQFADYDHDGAATEFLIPVGTLTCGQIFYAAVGISAANPHFHALSLPGHGGHPLVMFEGGWDALRDNAGPVTVRTEFCGDHGSDIRSNDVLSASNGTIHVHYHVYSCPTDASSEKRLEEGDR